MLGFTANCTAMAAELDLQVTGIVGCVGQGMLICAFLPVQNENYREQIPHPVRPRAHGSVRGLVTYHNDVCISCAHPNEFQRLFSRSAYACSVAPPPSAQLHRQWCED